MALNGPCSPRIGRKIPPRIATHGGPAATFWPSPPPANAGRIETHTLTLGATILGNKHRLKCIESYVQFGVKVDGTRTAETWLFFEFIEQDRVVVFLSQEKT